MSTENFNWIDYAVFAFMLAISTLIGIYFGLIKGGQDTVEGYLLGGKHMSVFPIAMSLVSSYISGITILGLPNEIYTFGSQYMVTNFGNIFAGIVTCTLILPVFYNLQLVSVFEYMEMRFDSKVRKFSSLLFTTYLLTYVPIVVYGPALALNQVSDMNVHVITPIVCIVCIFYTALGGLQAVVWSDAIQGIVMVGSTLAVLILGFVRVGGVQSVIDSAMESDRLDLFNMDPDPTVRLTFWSMITSGSLNSIAGIAINPANVQRYVSLPTLRQAKLAAIIMCLGTIFFLDLSGILGLVMYGEFKGCDPLRSQIIKRPDQILPHFVIVVSEKIKGLSGLFMAGVVCAALSTMSTCLNTVAGTFYKDFIEPLFKKKPSEKHASLAMKIMVVLLGALCTYLVTIVEKLGPITEISAGFGGVSSGVNVGLFILGLFFPWANAKGALCGGIGGLITMTWLVVGSSLAKIDGRIIHPTKPLSVDNCTHVFNSTMTNKTSDPDLFYPYRLSFFSFTLVGCVIVITIALFVSLLTGFNKGKEIDQELIVPTMRRFLPKKPYNAVRMDDRINTQKNNT